MKTLLILTLIGTSLITARFTGRRESFTTVTGQTAYRCEYEIPGRKFWVNFAGYGGCPATYEVY